MEHKITRYHSSLQVASVLPIYVPLHKSSQSSIVTTRAYVVDKGIILLGKLTILPAGFGTVGTTVWWMVSTKLAESVGTRYQFVWLSNDVSTTAVGILYLSVSTHCLRDGVLVKVFEIGEQNCCSYSLAFSLLYELFKRPDIFQPRSSNGQSIRTMSGLQLRSDQPTTSPCAHVFIPSLGKPRSFLPDHHGKR
ncbi:hypothetical protein J3R30DRAFT_3432558 [Lentinula aciculospora]|uniref:Uncharacterized protein n=1 Tax=Lentinula aciculospora TaxID=153920 RepID=A0A9W9DWW2_9AGAR|nr:hypothetical protein J3R30DRAFT_3432558 [Lentinula aciculospora]